MLDSLWSDHKLATYLSYLMGTGSDGRDLADQSVPRKYLILLNFSVKATSQYDINVRHSSCDVNYVFRLNINSSRVVGSRKNCNEVGSRPS